MTGKPDLLIQDVETSEYALAVAVNALVSILQLEASEQRDIAKVALEDISSIRSARQRQALAL